MCGPFKSLNVSDRMEAKATFPAAQDLQVRPRAEDKGWPISCQQLRPDPPLADLINRQEA